MINLLPPDIKQARIYGRRNRAMLGYSMLLLLTAGATAIIMVGSLQFVGSDESNLKNEIEQSNAEIVKLESEIKSIEAIANRLDTAKKLNEQSVRFSVLIPEIAAILPEGVTLNGLSLTGGKSDPLSLDVNLVNTALASVLVKNLVESELFEAADISSLTPRTVGEGDTSSAYRFTASITASFTGTAEKLKKEKAAEAAKKAAAEEAAKETGEQE